MDVERFFGFGLELVEWSCHIEGHGAGAFGFEGGELGGTAGCGYDFVAAGESFSGQSRAESRRAAGDEPDLARHVEFEVPEVGRSGASVLKKNAVGEC